MSYAPGPTPTNPEAVPAFLARELARISAATKDNAPSVKYAPGTISPAFTANNFKPNGLAAANVVRISTSATQTLTGIAQFDAWRELYVLNVGTGTLVLTSEDAASSASARFSLPATWNLSANASAHLWRDAISARWRGVSRT